MEDIKLKVDPINMKNQRVHKIRTADLFLCRSVMDIRIDFDGENMVNVEDEAMGWEVKRTCFNTVVKRDAITGVDMGFNDFGEDGVEHNNWYIQISAYGMPYDTKIYFKAEDSKLAAETFKTIKDWIFQPVEA
jgi:hypothetical protein